MPRRSRPQRPRRGGASMGQILPWRFVSTRLLRSRLWGTRMVAGRLTKPLPAPRQVGLNCLATSIPAAIARPNFGNTETDGRDQGYDYNPNERMKPIRKAVFPVAGLGTRFLPA